jgi:hypothetical protein
MRASDIAEKISELRSRILLRQTWVDQLRSNYMPDDAGAPEIRLRRDDGAAILKGHVEAEVEEGIERIAAMQVELEEWENLVFAPVTAKEKEPAAVVEIKKEKPRVATKRVNPSASPSK